MSEEHARQFVHTVEQDACLQQKIDALDPATAASEIVKLGAERDLHFSVEEFHHALTSHLQSPDHEISEEELSSVSGGVQGTHAVAHNPNTNASGVPHPTYWVKHGTINPGVVLNVSTDTGKSPHPHSPIGQAFL